MTVHTSALMPSPMDKPAHRHASDITGSTDMQWIIHIRRPCRRSRQSFAGSTSFAVTRHAAAASHPHRLSLTRSDSSHVIDRRQDLCAHLDDPHLEPGPYCLSSDRHHRQSHSTRMMMGRPTHSPPVRRRPALACAAATSHPVIPLSSNHILVYVPLVLPRRRQKRRHATRTCKHEDGSAREDDEYGGPCSKTPHHPSPPHRPPCLRPTSTPAVVYAPPSDVPTLIRRVHLSMCHAPRPRVSCRPSVVHASSRHAHTTTRKPTASKRAGVPYPGSLHAPSPRP